MRQSLSENPGTRRIESSSGRTAALLAVALSVVLAVVAIVDQAGGRSLIEHATANYAPYGKQPTAAALYGLVYGVAVIDALLWLLIAGIARTRAAAGVAVLALLITAALAVLLLVSSEYGFRIFTPLWGILALLPAAAGILATAKLFRRS